MKRAAAIFVLAFAVHPAFGQVSDEAPIRVAPPVVDDLPAKTDFRPPRTKADEPEQSRLDPTRRKIQPKRLDEMPADLEAPSRSRKGSAHVELDEIQPVRGEESPKSLNVPKLDSNPPLPLPKYAVMPDAIAPIPDGPPIEGVPSKPIQRPLYIDLQTINYTIPGSGGLFGEPGQAQDHWSHRNLFSTRFGDDAEFQLDGLFRGYYRNDQRIEWSGVEATFGAEGVLRPAFVSRSGDWIVSSQAEIFLNKRYGTSILSDANRDLYRTNFDVETFQIFQMFVEADYEDWSVRIGRSRTPFGRYQSPMYTNGMLDAPFIRTEVIGFVETGFFIRYSPDPVVVDLAIVNGEPDLDTNSSKALVSRVGLEEEWWTAGISVKVQDGVSSEFQKRFNNAFGIDGSVAIGRFLFYGEGVIDQHGFLRDAVNNPEYNPYNLGIRSLYARDIFKADETAISGNGAYIGGCYRGDKWLIDISYGRYIPERIGNPDHDTPINRLTFKSSYIAAKNLELYLSVIAENKRITEGLLSNSNPYAAWFGMQYGF